MTTEMGKRVLLSGYYGFDNYGDELILETLVHTLKAEGHTPVVLSANPDKTSAELRVEAAARMNPISILSALSSTDALISGGGGLFQDSTSIKSPIYYGGLIQLARWTSKPVAIFGQGLGPLKTKTGLDWTAHALENASIVVLRDTASVDWAKTHAGVDAELMSDTVWAHPADTQLVNEEDKKGVSISLRPHRGLTNDFYQQLVTNLQDPALGIGPETPISLLNCQEHEDTPPLTELEERLKASGYTQITLVKGLKGITEALSSSRYCIAMRFHVLLMALKLHIPTFALAYDPKVLYLSDRCGIPFHDMTTATGEDGKDSPLALLAFEKASPESIAGEIKGAQEGLAKLTRWVMALET